jgi:hypothetical protein
MNKSEIKSAVVEDIMAEINEVPAIYLTTLIALIHAFKENVLKIPLPTQTNSNDVENEFDWDEMLTDIHLQRQKNNEIQFQKMNGLFSDL